MVEKEPPHEKSVKRSSAAAGGWGALAASARHIWKGGDVPRSIMSLLRVNQPDGFDCPGCAWPEPDRTSTFEFCENGVKAVAWESTGKRVTRELFARHTVSELRERSDHWLESQGRLTEPMAYNRETDRYEPIEWATLFRRIGDPLRELDSPDRAIFYTSGRTSNEAAFLLQPLARRLGTNNLPDCSNMCHESSGRALTESIGIGKGTVQLDDFARADAIFVIGQNPGTNHPRMLTELREASRRGARIVAINPLRERGLEKFAHPQDVGEMLTGRATPISTLYLQPLVGGDLALLKGIMKLVLEAESDRPGEVLDGDFIRDHTSGLESLAADLESTDWEAIEHACGVSRDDMRRAADIYIESKRTIACWAMGLTQQKHAVATIQTIVNLMLLRGNIGRPGAGICPVRGHSNVQGDRTVGIVERPAPEFLDGLRDAFGFDPPREHGLDTVAAIEAMHEGRAGVFFAMGGNFAVATPDTPYTEEALRRCDVTAHVSTKLNRSHLVCGRQAFILPCLGRTEVDVQASGPQRVTVEDSMGVVHATRGSSPPASRHLLSEPRIVAELAVAIFGSDDTIPWLGLVADYDRIRDRIEEVIPAFAGYNQLIDLPGGFPLRNSAREREWSTQSGRAEFRVHAIPDLDLPDGQLRLMTVRSHDQFNTTIYGLDDRYRGIRGRRRVVFLNRDDIASLGLREGDEVDLIACWPGDDAERRAPRFLAVAYDVPRGCAAAYFPETNVLVAVDRYADVSRTPMSKLIPVRVERSADSAP